MSYLYVRYDYSDIYGDVIDDFLYYKDLNSCINAILNTYEFKHLSSEYLCRLDLFTNHEKQFLFTLDNFKNNDIESIGEFDHTYDYIDSGRTVFKKILEKDGKIVFFDGYDNFYYGKMKFQNT